MLEKSSLNSLREALETLDEGFCALPAFTPDEPPSAAMKAVLQETAIRLQDNYPYFHPLYAGQMLKPPHPIARAAYALAMWINPNNHALDGGRASSRMEIEAVAALAEMFGWKEHLGHLTTSGTLANLEALWVAGQSVPGKTIVASSQAHYTHHRISGVLQLPFESIAVDTRGRMSIPALEQRLQAGDIGTVVATAGTTAAGALDPLPEILRLRERYGFRIHVDAAYGGYFRLASNLSPYGRAVFAAISHANSIALDPHKHGLQPYGCGCVLFRDPNVGKFYKHDSPYTYFTSSELHLGEISLECSRAGAAAVALWATQRLLPLTQGGEFAQMLESCRNAALKTFQRLQASKHFVVTFEPELDILIWALRGSMVAVSAQCASAIFDAAARQHLHLALVQMPTACFPAGTWLDQDRSPTITCLRSVMMKPEHDSWHDAIWQRLMAATEEVMA
ncbi:MAG TPA: pyridoxal-dependent decarboxylase [Acidobacteriaceae bacterium]|nr:pyridoxal-dependent decarboxylase [Acidobacteriaceae bacterium]